MIGVSPELVPQIWKQVRGHIEAALEHGNGEYELADIFMALCEGKMQLWATDKSVAVTSIIQYPRRQTCLIVIAGGDLADLTMCLPLVEEWALYQGCDGMEVMGRKGWLKALPDYEQAQVHLRKDLGCIPSSEVH